MLQRGFKWCHRGSDVFYMKASFAKTDMSVFIFLNHVLFFLYNQGKIDQNGVGLFILSVYLSLGVFHSSYVA